LDLQGALSEREAMDFSDPILHLGFQDYIVTCYAKVDVSVSNE
jgi:hypothetical protein